MFVGYERRVYSSSTCLWCYRNSNYLFQFPGSRQYYYMIFSAAVLPTTNLILIKRFRESLKRVFLELLSKIKIVKGISTVVLTTSIAMRKIHLISHMR
uniref:Uncharacterized protein n=1 Tax=Wuchereria bancrofti TaxID=6293 RepID=A0AAF5PYY7_WUCBA